MKTPDLKKRPNATQYLELFLSEFNSQCSKSMFEIHLVDQFLVYRSLPIQMDTVKAWSCMKRLSKEYCQDGHQIGTLPEIHKRCLLLGQMASALSTSAISLILNEKSTQLTKGQRCIIPGKCSDFRLRG